MFINKILETTVDLFDSNEIYHHDMEKLLIDKLTAKYVKKCYKSIYILNILRIVMRSSINMTDNRLDGSAFVHVTFEVKGVIFITGEILQNCRIADIQSNIITAEHEFAVISLSKEPSGIITQTLQIGQYIPVIVQFTKYNINLTECSMAAIPFTPTLAINVIYIIQNGLNEVETKQVQLALQDIQEEEQKHKSIVKEKAYDFFKSIMYPFKTNYEYDQMEQFKILGVQPISIELKEISKIKSGVIVYPVEDNRINKRFYWNPNADTNIVGKLDDQNGEDKTNELIIYGRLYPVIADIISKYNIYMKGLREFVEIYDSKKLIETQLYWKLCRSLQQD